MKIINVNYLVKIWKLYSFDEIDETKTFCLHCELLIVNY